MKQLVLGNSNLRVSQLCLGTMNFGSRDSKATAFAVLDAFSEAGGNFIDTANTYAHWIEGCIGGEAELAIGEWLKRTRKRSDMIIATKVGMAYGSVPEGLRESQIIAECDKSLKRLAVDTIDLYYAHIDDRSTPLHETLGAFERLIREGKVRAIGASNFRTWRVERSRNICNTNNWSSYCCIQQRYSYVRPKSGAQFTPQIFADDETIDYCLATGLTLVAYSPIERGAYQREDRKFPAQFLGHENADRLSVLESVCHEVDASPNQVVLAWMLNGDMPVMPVIGLSSKEQLTEAIQAANLQLSREHMDRLNSARTWGTAW